MKHDDEKIIQNIKGTAPKPFVAAKEGQLPVTKNTNIIAEKTVYSNVWKADITDKGR